MRFPRHALNMSDKKAYAIFPTLQRLHHNVCQVLLACCRHSSCGSTFLNLVLLKMPVSTSAHVFRVAQFAYAPKKKRYLVSRFPVFVSLDAITAVTRIKYKEFGSFACVSSRHDSAIDRMCCSVLFEGGGALGPVRGQTVAQALLPCRTSMFFVAWVRWLFRIQYFR